MTDRVHLKLGRFALVGIAATALYAVLAWLLVAFAGAAPLVASVVAYAGASCWSYLAHRSITFRSGRAHAAAVPRFALTTLCGMALASGLTILGERLGLRYEFAIAATCVAVPVFSFLVLDRIVFARPAVGGGAP
ncbi:GtrA family protein [Methylopila sp. M107]|uniref:GtrA family protein n=1 Tax=Methylopila sp. M107 TaxID=1101190 RepID=UPI0003A17780|nr:GtrA family protein [Methylopila sp. M107]